jgi:hypothetical protein
MRRQLGELILSSLHRPLRIRPTLGPLQHRYRTCDEARRIGQIK